MITFNNIKPPGVLRKIRSATRSLASDLCVLIQDFGSPKNYIWKTTCNFGNMSDKRNVAKQTPPIPIQNSETSPDQKDAKSLDDLWKEAVTRIQKENGVSLPAISESDSDALQQPDQRLQKASELFEKSRHPDERKTKVIKAVSGCLDWTYSGVTFFKDHVSGTVRRLLLLLVTTLSSLIGHFFVVCSARPNCSGFGLVYDPGKSSPVLDEQTPADTPHRPRKT